MRETLDQWVHPEDLRPLLLRPAAIALGIGMHELFREACEWMLSQGVDPVAATDRGGRPRGFESARAQSELERTMETLEKLRLLLDGEKPGDGRAGILRDFTHTLPASFVALQDMSMVEPMFMACTPGGCALDPPPPQAVVFTSKRYLVVSIEKLRSVSTSTTTPPSTP